MGGFTSRFENNLYGIGETAEEAVKHLNYALRVYHNTTLKICAYTTPRPVVQDYFADVNNERRELIVGQVVDQVVDQNATTNLWVAWLPKNK